MCHKFITTWVIFQFLLLFYVTFLINVNKKGWELLNLLIQTPENDIVSWFRIIFHQNSMEKGIWPRPECHYTYTYMYVRAKHKHLPSFDTHELIKLHSIPLVLSYTTSIQHTTTKKRQTFFCHHLTFTYIHRSLSYTFAILLSAQFFFPKSWKCIFVSGTFLLLFELICTNAPHVFFYHHFPCVMFLESCIIFIIIIILAWGNHVYNVLYTILVPFLNIKWKPQTTKVQKKRHE